MVSFQYLPLSRFFTPSMVLGQQGCRLAGNAEDEVGTLKVSLGEHCLLSPPSYLIPEMLNCILCSASVRL